MLLSLITGAISLANAAAFLLLAPGPSLADFISASVIYGSSAWIALWIIPTAWSFDKSRLQSMRTAQLLISSVGSSLLIITHPTVIGISLALLLWAEIGFFLSAILLLESETRIYQKLEFSRSLLNSCSLLLTVFLFSAAPSSYCLLLLGTTLIVGAASVVLGVNRPKLVALNVSGLVEAIGELKNAFRVPQFRALLGARAIEALTLQIFNWTGMLGSQICFKIGVAVSQSLSTNARQQAKAKIIITAAAIYIFSVGITVAFNGFDMIPLPPTFKHITIFSGLSALLPIFVFLWLTLTGLEKRIEP